MKIMAIKTGKDTGTTIFILLDGYNDYAVKFFNKIYSEKSPYLKIQWEGH